MSEVTRILEAIERGDPQATDKLLPLVYDELRRLAAQRLSHEKPGQTLQATALVHEAYIRSLTKGVCHAMVGNIGGGGSSDLADGGVRVLVWRLGK
jgi:hypothetical protein